MERRAMMGNRQFIRTTLAEVGARLKVYTAKTDEVLKVVDAALLDPGIDPEAWRETMQGAMSVIRFVNGELETIFNQMASIDKEATSGQTTHLDNAQADGHPDLLER